MSRTADAVIIGAGVIGSNIAYELARKGYKTLNIDKLPAAGYGPTSASCAIVRAHYSSWDGVAMAYEGFSYWQDWENYLGVEDESGLAKYMNCGTLLLESATGHHEKVLGHYRDVGVEYEEWTPTSCSSACRSRPARVLSAQAPRGPALLGPVRGDPRRRGLHAGLGLRQRPAAGLAQPPAGRGGERRRVPLPRDRGRDPPRQRAGRGGHAERRPRDRRADRHQRRRPPLDIINRMAGATGDMNVSTRPLRHEVHHVPAPPDFDYDMDGVHMLGRRHRHLLPARERQPHPDRLRGSRLRRAPVGHDPDELRPPRHRGAVGGPGLPPRPPHPVAADPERAQGGRRPLRRLGRLDPDLRPVRRRRLLHGDRHQRQPVQERPGRRARDGRADRPGRERPRPRQGPGQGASAATTTLELDMGFYSRLREINPNSSFSVNG